MNNPVNLFTHCFKQRTLSTSTSTAWSFISTETCTAV